MSDIPDNSKVICPACCHQFAAISVDDQAERSSLRADLARVTADLERTNEKYNAVVIQENEHCKDCCCARSWDALGIDKYTGKSIPEHIGAIVDQRDRLLVVARGLKKYSAFIPRELKAALDAVADLVKP